MIPLSTGQRDRRRRNLSRTTVRSSPPDCGLKVPTPVFLPELFVRLHDDGRFDYTGTQPGQAREGQALLWDEVEWGACGSPEEIAAFSGDDFLRPGLIPFAGNGRGDYYCWYPPWQSGPEPPVVFAVHDELSSYTFARTFEEFLVRCMLEHFAAVEDADGRSSWQAQVSILTPVLSTGLASRLARLGSAPSRDACRRELTAIKPSDDERSLVAFQPPTRFAADIIGSVRALDAYDESIAFYRSLVEEGRTDFRANLELAEENRRLLAQSDSIPGPKERLAQAWAGVSSRRCPNCAKPCPKFRKTCAFCRHHVGRG